MLQISNIQDRKRRNPMKCQHLATIAEAIEEETQPISLHTPSIHSHTPPQIQTQSSNALNHMAYESRHRLSVCERRDLGYKRQYQATRRIIRKKTRAILKRRPRRATRVGPLIAKVGLSRDSMDSCFASSDADDRRFNGTSDDECDFQGGSFVGGRKKVAFRRCLRRKRLRNSTKS